jgi:hypothetical protein
VRAAGFDIVTCRILYCNRLVATSCAHDPNVRSERGVSDLAEGHPE